MTDEELKKLLQENLEISRESLKLLRKLNRDRIYSRIYGFLKIAFWVAIAVGSYVYVEPYLRSLLEMLSQISSGVGTIQKTGQAISPSNLSIPPELIKQLQSLFGQ